MRIEAVTVCVNYADFLARTLPTVRSQVDAMAVVTAPFDADTARLAAGHGCSVLATDAFYRGDAFNKGRALEEFFASDVFELGGWVLVVDADIALPPTARAVIERMVLQPDTLYGASRLACPTSADWDCIGAEQGAWHVDHLQPFPVRAELAGFFHLFRPGAMKRPWYPTDWGHAGGQDSVFEQRWPKQRKERLPIATVHLGDHRANWFGRVTPRWDGGECGGPGEARIREAGRHYTQVRKDGVRAIDAREGRL